jgi:hypothetical protein
MLPYLYVMEEEASSCILTGFIYQATFFHASWSLFYKKVVDYPSNFKSLYTFAVSKILSECTLLPICHQPL